MFTNFLIHVTYIKMTFVKKHKKILNSKMDSCIVKVQVFSSVYK